MDHLDAQLAKKKAAEEAARLAEEAKKNGTEVPAVAELKTEYKVRKTKNVSIKQMTGTASWRLESVEDIDKYIAELRKTLVAQMDGDTIVNVEF
jgi:tRNA A-37 threonylcarbamoyl transferase component Bud32